MAAFYIFLTQNICLYAIFLLPLQYEKSNNTLTLFNINNFVLLD